MKKLGIVLLALVMLLSMGATVPAHAESEQLHSGYYGIDREAGLVGQVMPGTDQDTFLSRILPTGALTLSDGIVTGSVLSLSREGSVLDSLTLVVLSDCSGDGVFSVSDMLMVKSCLLNQRTFSSAQAQAADVSGDNAVTITDFLQMKSKVLEMLDFSPRYLATAEPEPSVILTVGQTCEFGPADGVLEGADGKLVTLEGNAVTWEAGIATATCVGTSRLTFEGQSLILTVCEEAVQVTLPQSVLTVLPGATAPLQPTVNHPISSHSFTYSVADPEIATVDSQGIVSGVTTGTTQVTVTLPNGNTATQDIRVIHLIDTLALEKDSIKVKPNGKKALGFTVSPAESPEKLIWSSSDPSIATVDDHGVVTGVAKGYATITCSTEYGKIKDTCKVKVCNLIQVALTFDDGPSSQYTMKLLNQLEKHDAKATFFMVGNRISTAPSAVKKMVEDGHELGYHTWGHTYFNTMSASTIRSDLEKFQNTLKSTCGQTATVYRAPGGTITGTTLNTIDMPHILWCVDTRDWENRNSWSVRTKIINNLWDGAIIIMHDIYSTTYDGTVSALEYVSNNDLDVEFVTVTELLSRDGTPPQSGTTYYRD